MSEQLINSKLDELNSLPAEESANLYIPVETAIQEAGDLYRRCKLDKEELLKGKLDWSLVEDIEIRIGALQQSQSQWQAKFRNYQVCQEEWKITAPLAYKLRSELLHYLRHALRDIPIELAKVRRISEGNSQVEMIQDLSDLAELGKIHSAELEALNFDLSKLDEAREKARNLTKLLSEVRGAYKETSPFIELRNKAYTHLKEAVDEIREVGQFVFWEDSKKLKLYSSEFIRKKGKTQNKKEDQSITEG